MTDWSAVRSCCSCASSFESVQATLVVASGPIVIDQPLTLAGPAYVLQPELPSIVPAPLNTAVKRRAGQRRDDAAIPHVVAGHVPRTDVGRLDRGAEHDGRVPADARRVHEHEVGPVLRPLSGCRKCREVVGLLRLQLWRGAGHRRGAQCADGDVAAVHRVRAREVVAAGAARERPVRTEHGRQYRARQRRHEVAPTSDVAAHDPRALHRGGFRGFVHEDRRSGLVEHGQAPSVGLVRGDQPKVAEVGRLGRHGGLGAQHRRARHRPELERAIRHRVRARVAVTAAAATRLAALHEQRHEDPVRDIRQLAVDEQLVKVPRGAFDLGARALRRRGRRREPSRATPMATTSEPIASILAVDR